MCKLHLILRISYHNIFWQLFVTWIQVRYKTPLIFFLKYKHLLHKYSHQYILCNIRRFFYWNGNIAFFMYIPQGQSEYSVCTQIKWVLLISTGIHTYRYYCYVTLTLHKTKLIPCVRNKNALSLCDSWVAAKTREFNKAGHSLLMSIYI